MNDFKGRTISLSPSKHTDATALYLPAAFRPRTWEQEELDDKPTGQTLLLTVDDAATALSLGRTFVYQLVMRGDLASIKIGSRRRIPVAALEDFVTQRMAEQDQRKGGI